MHAAVYAGAGANVLLTAFGYVDPESVRAENIAHSAMYTYKGGEQNISPCTCVRP
jgi:hypothetical protein